MEIDREKARWVAYMAMHFADGGSLEVMNFMDDGWVTANWIPNLSSNREEWRIKPRTIRIGDVEIEAPETEAPENGTPYYLPSPNGAEVLYTPGTWRGDWYQLTALRHRRIHLAKENAIAHAKAEILVAGGCVDE